MQAFLRWGIVGAANIALKKVIPAMQRAPHSQVVAIASRDGAKSRQAAASLGIPKAYESYEALLADPAVDAVYIPLPNHLHVPWSIRAAEAGKHVLCEKPIALSTAELRTLIEARNRNGVLIGEAFMVRSHPQWIRARELARQGEIGELRLIRAAFSYFNRDPANVRNQADIGGGALLDIGCYPITMARFLFGAEPTSVSAAVDRDPIFKTDRQTSAILQFPRGQTLFSCATQLVPYQSFQLLGSAGRIDIAFPFNTPPTEIARIRIDDGTHPIAGQSSRTEEFPALDQYTLQAESFAAAVRDGSSVPVSLEDSFGNTAVLEALFRSSQTDAWETPAAL